MVYLGACLIVGIRLAKERQVNVRVIPTNYAIDESIDLAHEISSRVFRKDFDRVADCGPSPAAFRSFVLRKFSSRPEKNRLDSRSGREVYKMSAYSNSRRKSRLELDGAP